MARRKDRREGWVSLRLGRLRETARVLALKRGHKTMTGYLRELISRGLAEDLRTVPGLYLWLRPGATVFKQNATTEVFTPQAQGIGGERVWILGVIDALPSGMGGGVGYLCDITAGDTRGGLEGRGVVVRADDTAGQ